MSVLWRGFSEIEVVSSLCADDDFFFLPVVAPIF